MLADLANVGLKQLRACLSSKDRNCRGSCSFREVTRKFQCGFLLTCTRVSSVSLLPLLLSIRCVS